MADLWSSTRLIYRGVDNEDEAFLADLSADAEAFLNVAPLLPVPRSKKAIQEYREYLQEPVFLLSAIVCLPPPPSASSQADTAEDKAKEKPKPTPVGVITLRGEPPRTSHHRHCDIGINLLRAYQGQGYGTEAIQWSLRWGFKRANLHRMSIGAFAWNQGAIRLYEKLGFVHEGVRRDFFWHDGRYQDAVDLAMLEDEWRTLYDHPQD
ncbi:hypothetical protein M409DRAFT_52959 [Zasmidium cellare ATCC 36951]|uniref:N-acetyltransferase domain-containing protein n=1 Tax=Zasmidium cellare ATCC 36951 TaxID=1080233 RepID=A0A6A6CPJ7_ZASCE|nr:uncharacterized protein M409DRAFT_52959 [Zasmidium cellare ATCC 36951]KAF2168981.1 hypothetical protein M409DRAFT_52959 [Zasmidium cellare ATCC 36951]